MNHKIIVGLLFTCIVIVASTLISQAQILPPPPPDPAGVPLDPLSWLILGAGGIFAGKKYLDSKKKKK